jgi:hypothetical protein
MVMFLISIMILVKSKKIKKSWNHSGGLYYVVSGIGNRVWVRRTAFYVHSITLV